MISLEKVLLQHRKFILRLVKVLQFARKLAYYILYILYTCLLTIDRQDADKVKHIQAGPQ